jgi:putative membrane protein
MMRPSLITGLLALAGLWLGPLPRLAGNSFAGHMTLHMGVVTLAAPLIALGLAGGRFDPVARMPGWFAPVPASLVELVVVWGWHAPAAHHWARSSAVGLALEQATFLGSGLLLWLAVLGADGRAGAERTGAGIFALLLTSMHMTLLGALLALPPRVLYPHHTHGAHAFGLSPLQDQHLGGAIMLLFGGVVYLLGGLWLSAIMLRRRPDTETTQEAGRP